mmetsp:Transcript_11755/g.24211  ORF Transcript_11755/g.24211 Transcript_11755/m.24211 type:complete len:200 (-) Transcript_11755:589-1188(-)
MLVTLVVHRLGRRGRRLSRRRLLILILVLVLLFFNGNNRLPFANDILGPVNAAKEGDATPKGSTTVEVMHDAAFPETTALLGRWFGCRHGLLGGRSHHTEDAILCTRGEKSGTSSSTSTISGTTSGSISITISRPVPLGGKHHAGNTQRVANIGNSTIKLGPQRDAAQVQGTLVIRKGIGIGTVGLLKIGETEMDLGQI